MNPHHRSAGFTLVELVTTIVILGLLSAVALPRMFDNQSFGERGYIDEVAASLRYAQKIAIASECPVQMTLNAGNYSALQPANANCTGGWATQVSRGDGSNVAGTAPANVVLNPATTIVFAKAGGTNGVAAPALTVGAFTLNVDIVTGSVVVTP